MVLITLFKMLKAPFLTVPTLLVGICEMTYLIIDTGAHRSYSESGASRSDDPDAGTDYNEAKIKGMVT